MTAKKKKPQDAKLRQWGLTVVELLVMTAMSQTASAANRYNHKKWAVLSTNTCSYTNKARHKEQM